MRIFGSKQDITSDRQAMESLRRQAETDPLTGLANRSVFQARYREVVGDSLNHGFASALVLIDLDRFKDLNDTLGHPAGDACLCEVARRLGQAFQKAGLVARLGGDEFAIILRAPTNPARIAHVLQQTIVMLSRPLFWNGLRLEVGASIGAALVGRPHRRRITELFAEADIALYDAKAAGRNKVHLFGDEGTAGPRRQVAENAVEASLCTLPCHSVFSRGPSRCAEGTGCVSNLVTKTEAGPRSRL